MILKGLGALIRTDHSESHHARRETAMLTPEVTANAAHIELQLSSGPFSFLRDSETLPLEQALSAGRRADPLELASIPS